MVDFCNEYFFKNFKENIFQGYPTSKMHFLPIIFKGFSGLKKSILKNMLSASTNLFWGVYLPHPHFFYGHSEFGNTMKLVCLVYSVCESLMPSLYAKLTHTNSHNKKTLTT